LCNVQVVTSCAIGVEIRTTRECLKDEAKKKKMEVFYSPNQHRKHPGRFEEEKKIQMSRVNDIFNKYHS
jgi:hypothetical protein